MRKYNNFGTVVASNKNKNAVLALGWSRETWLLGLSLPWSQDGTKNKGILPGKK